MGVERGLLDGLFDGLLVEAGDVADGGERPAAGVADQDARVEGVGGGLGHVAQVAAREDEVHDAAVGLADVPHPGEPGAHPGAVPLQFGDLGPGPVEEAGLLDGEGGQVREPGEEADLLGGVVADAPVRPEQGADDGLAAAQGRGHDRVEPLGAQGGFGVLVEGGGVDARVEGSGGANRSSAR